MSRLTRDGTAEPVSRDQILRHARGQGNIIFPVQLTTSRIGNLTRLIHTLLYVMTIHTYSPRRADTIKNTYPWCLARLNIYIPGMHIYYFMLFFHETYLNNMIFFFYQRTGARGPGQAPGSAEAHYPDGGPPPYHDP